MKVSIDLITTEALSRLLPHLRSPVPWENWDVRTRTLAEFRELPPGEAKAVVAESAGNLAEITEALRAVAGIPQVLVLETDQVPQNFASPTITLVPANALDTISSVLFDRLEQTRVDDRVAWLHRIGGDKFVHQMTTLVGTEIPKLIGMIQIAARSADLDAIRKSAHRLRSSAGHVGASTVGAIAAKLEDAGHTLTPGDITTLAQELGTVWDRVAPRILEHSRRTGA